MDRIAVTPEMRKRVLERVAQEDIAPARSRVLPFPALKKYLSAAACLALLIAGAAVLPRLLAPAQPEPPPVMLPPIMEEAESLQELSGLVGFEATENFALPFPVEDTEYLAYGSDLAQVTYAGAGQTAVYRQSPGTEDNSGDYNSYGSTGQLAVGSMNVTLKGEAGSYVLAIWTDDTFSYSLWLSEGISETGWLALLDGKE